MYKGERFNGYSHFVGALAALLGMWLLLWPAVSAAEVWKAISFAVYGLSLFALYVFSTLYHSSRGVWKPRFRQLDHLAIYLLIAGTYTPFLLVVLRDGDGLWMSALIWGLALLGMLLEVLPKGRRRLWSILVYLSMGWLALLVLRPLSAALPQPAVALLLGGGVAYSAGILFYVFDKQVRHFHGIWHLFVLCGSICHYLSIYLYIA